MSGDPRVSFKPVYVGGDRSWRIERTEVQMLDGSWRRVHEAEAQIRALQQSEFVTASGVPFARGADGAWRYAGDLIYDADDSELAEALRLLDAWHSPQTVIEWDDHDRAGQCVTCRFLARTLRRQADERLSHSGG